MLNIVTAFLSSQTPANTASLFSTFIIAYFFNTKYQTMLANTPRDGTFYIYILYWLRLAVNNRQLMLCFI